MSHDDDVFNKIRMQGHSHVNMAVSPSSVDLSLYERLLDQLSSDMFYIFMIWNKRGEKTVKIYDIRENILFETADVTVTIKGMEDMMEFLEDAKELVVTKTYNYGYGTGAYPYNYPGYGATKKDEQKNGTSLGKHQPLVSTGKKSKGRKGKRKKDKSAGKQMSMSDYGYPGCDDYDDYDDTDIHGGINGYSDDYWKDKYGFDY